MGFRGLPLKRSTIYIRRNIMKKFLFIISSVLMLLLVGCGSNDTTYLKEAPVVPDEPTNGNTILVQADNDSSVGLQFTDLGDGSILITCGDGNNYTCGVFDAVPVEPAM